MSASRARGRDARPATVRGELAGLARIARKQRWHIVRAPDDHLDWYPPWSVTRPVRTASTIGQGRSFANTRADLLRAGLMIPGRERS